MTPTGADRPADRPAGDRAAGRPAAPAAGVAVTAVESTDRFTGSEAAPLQVVRVRVRRERPAGPLTVHVRGPRVATPRPRRLMADAVEAFALVDGEAGAGAGAAGDTAPAARETDCEVSVDTGSARPGDVLPVTAVVEDAHGAEVAALRAGLTVEQPGWTIHLVPHFHYDPMWWNTQAAYTSRWDRALRPGEPAPAWEYTGVPAFTLIPLHLQQAADDPDYRFVLSETDYFKPFWDSHPEYRDELRALLAEGRLELVGGTYNEPSTNLTGAESTVRNAAHGLAFHRGVVGGDPRTAWQLDVFGHDPSFPALLAGAGLDSAVLARGPHHHWGPMFDAWGEELRPATAMQHPADHAWIGPSGAGLLLHYLPAHYSSGWFSNACESVEEATRQLVELYGLLKGPAATRNVLVPVGTDFSWPHRWAPQVRRRWNERYVWPRFAYSTPRDYFAAVRAELAERGERPLPVTRDLNPVYTGKDVSYADVKRANREAEGLVAQAETFAALAAALGAGTYPHAALSKAWRHLLHGAHHDGVTGTFSDQVYVDLVPTWREAHDLAVDVRGRALGALAERADTASGAADGPSVAVTVFNSLSFDRRDVVRVTADVRALRLADASRLGVRGPAADGGADAGGSPGGDGGGVAPVLLEAVAADGDGTVTEVSVAFLADGVPGIGYRTWWLVDAGRPLSAGWTADAPDGSGADGSGADDSGADGGGAAADLRAGDGRAVIANGVLRAEADPSRGGGLCRVTDLRTGQEVLTPGEVDELVVYEEHSAHPYFGEGPWHLLPTGASEGSAAAPAESLRVERSPLGARITATGRTGPARWTRVHTLWHGVDRLELTTRVDAFTGADQLLRLRVPADVRGALPVAETAAAAIGRGFGFPATDTGADHTRAPWTLDSGCLNWFALSSTATVSLTAPDGTAAGRRAIGAAEIVLPDAGLPGHGIPAGADDGDPLRGFVTALVRRGVTAVPTRPDGTRWGDLRSDSGLPDVRFALGGPEENAFTAAVLAAADPACTAAVRAARARAAETGTPQLVWVPAVEALRPSWLPGADLTAPDALPVAVVLAPAGSTGPEPAGADAPTGPDAAAPPAPAGFEPAGFDAAALDRLAAALDAAPSLDAVLAAPGGHPAADDLADRTTALLVRGTPGFVVDTAGRLHSNLLRSSTGRPSGQWMDPPARTAPDGSSFQLQHWTHTFEHALVTAAGDWRAADLDRRGRAFATPLTAVAAAPSPGPLPAAHALLTAGPADHVQVEAVKPADGGRLAVRLRETSGSAADAVLTLPGATAAYRADLLDTPGVRLPGGGADGGAADGDASVALRLDGNAYTTVVLDPPASAPAGAGAGAAPLGPVREPGDGPVPSRYWLHNTGTAPLGNTPLTVTADPALRTAAPGTSVDLAVTVSAGHPAYGADVLLTTTAPDGWPQTATDPDQHTVTVPPGGRTVRAVRLTVPPDTPPGEYLFRVTAAPGDGGPAYQDTATIAVPDPAAPDTPPPLLTVDLTAPDHTADTADTDTADRTTDGAATADTAPATADGPHPLTVDPGGRAELTARLHNPLASPVRGRLLAVSPHGSWDAIPRPGADFALEPGGRAEVRIPVAPPPTAAPGEYWLLVKAVYDGRITYSPAVTFRVRGSRPA